MIILNQIVSDISLLHTFLIVAIAETPNVVIFLMMRKVLFRIIEKINVEYIEINGVVFNALNIIKMPITTRPLPLLNNLFLFPEFSYQPIHV